MVNKTCKVCGKEYTYCPKCDHKEPLYKTMFCSETCRHIWDILSENGVGKSSAVETLDKLMRYEIPKTLTESIQRHIDELINEVEVDE